MAPWGLKVGAVWLFLVGSTGAEGAPAVVLAVGANVVWALAPSNGAAAASVAGVELVTADWVLELAALSATVLLLAPGESIVVCFARGEKLVLDEFSGSEENRVQWDECSWAGGSVCCRFGPPLHRSEGC